MTVTASFDIQPLQDGATAVVIVKLELDVDTMQFSAGRGLVRVLYARDPESGHDTTVELHGDMAGAPKVVVVTVPDSGQVDVAVEVPMATSYGWGEQLGQFEWIARLDPSASSVRVSDVSEAPALGTAAALLIAFVLLAVHRLQQLKIQLLTFRGVPEEVIAEVKKAHPNPYRRGRPEVRLDVNEILPAEALAIVRARVALAIAFVSVPAIGVAFADADLGVIPMGWSVAAIVAMGLAGGATYLRSVFTTRRPLFAVLLVQAFVAAYLLGAGGAVLGFAQKALPFFAVVALAAALMGPRVDLNPARISQLE